MFILLAAPAWAVDYQRDVRPILAQNCFLCHGPDNADRQAGLRLDVREQAIAELESGNHAIVPGDADASELWTRVASTDESLLMPPTETGNRLSPDEIDVLRAWITEGAPYAAHWAYVKPARPPLPEVADTAWPQNAIDVFVLARLEQEGLSPSEPADRYALARRVSFDLVGLPPEPAEIEDFVNDPRPDAYEQFVDRLLAKSVYGERWATLWLDVARYADSQGYAPDGPRTIWRWRDWVIDALNANMPFDRFTILQLAGDLLPGATPADLLATAFHRNTQLNTEGGVNLEEFRHAAVVDRVNTTFVVWLGTSFACAQCHNHKYDPFSQREYYEVFSIFNHTDDFNTDEPVVEIAPAGREAVYARLKADLAEVQQLWDAQTSERDAAQAEWEATVTADSLPEEIAAILAVAPEERDQGQADKLADYHRALSADWKRLNERLETLRKEFANVSTTAPIMRDGTPRPTFVYHRGDFQSPGDSVAPGVPAALHHAPPDTELNRLGLARWLVDADNPLTPRVAVNRLWQELFGIGIVETAEEFGIQGEPPSHAELLDWLAVEYRESGWDTKHVLKLMVTSATYRQSSRTADALVERDPHNRLLGRGPRVRLSAEMLRDQALAVSGLLSMKMHGDPVQPPQPASGLAAAFGGSTDWKPSEGEDRYRRAIYTRWRRNLPYPSLVSFDAPDRNICSVRRIHTNTPLQALVTLNDPVFIECAQGLGRRVLASESDSAQRARRMLELTVCRPAIPEEIALLIELYEQSREMLERDASKALALATNPLGPLPEGVDPIEAAAWTVVANVVLNLDETLSKP